MSAVFPAIVTGDESVFFATKVSPRCAADHASAERWSGLAQSSIRSPAPVKYQPSRPLVIGPPIPRSGSRVLSRIPANPLREGHQPSGKSKRQPPAPLSTRARPAPVLLVAGLGVGRGVGIGGIVFREGSNGCGVASGARSVSDSNGWPIHHRPDASRASRPLAVLPSGTDQTKLDRGLPT